MQVALATPGPALQTSIKPTLECCRPSRTPPACSMDELRQELERGDGGEGLVTGLIKWLGDAANTAAANMSPLQVRGGCTGRHSLSWPAGGAGRGCSRL